MKKSATAICVFSGKHQLFTGHDSPASPKSHCPESGGGGRIRRGLYFCYHYHNMHPTTVWIMDAWSLGAAPSRQIRNDKMIQLFGTTCLCVCVQSSLPLQTDVRTRVVRLQAPKPQQRHQNPTQIQQRLSRLVGTIKIAAGRH